MIIYSHSITPRLQYIIDFLGDYYGHDFIVTSKTERYLSFDGPRINYSHERISEDELYIYPYALLFETGKRPVLAKCFEHNGYTTFFKTEGSVGFDLFAAIFYLLTRYEEYLPGSVDEYGRYDHKHSLAFKENFLHQPIVNIWLEDFRCLLELKGITTNKQSFSFLPSYDVDIAWSYLNKGTKRNLGGFAHDLLHRQWWYVEKRWKVLRKKEQDPFDTYSLLHQLHEQYQLKPIYFFPLAEKTSKYDKNTDPGNSNYKELIQEHSRKYDIGLHPSWQSGDHPHLLTKELKMLDEITGHNVKRSRQHYIRMAMPQTYRKLIALGIEHDYSMGYGAINGFRASIATPFYWYDVERDAKTNLLVHPFCFMDANAFFELKLTPEQALEEALDLYNKVKKINGQYCILWHPPFLGTDKLFKGWREVYEELLRQVK